MCDHGPEEGDRLQQQCTVKIGGRGGYNIARGDRRRRRQRRTESRRTVSEASQGGAKSGFGAARSIQAAGAEGNLWLKRGTPSDHGGHEAGIVHRSNKPPRGKGS